ncbi:MAG: histidinol-phosphate transaminase [Bdellovibrionota bacterium]
MELSWSPEVPLNIASLVPYPPGKPIEETERELGITGVVKLASNENPLGPSLKALRAIENAAKSLHLYPDGSHFHLKKALSRYLGCNTDEISIGCGSNEFIDLLPRIFVGKNRNLVTHKTAFVIYKLCAQLQGCGLFESPVDEDLNVDVDALLKTVNQDTKLVCLANPNNPTGTFLDADKIDYLARSLYERQILFMLDSAYCEYVTDPAIPNPIAVYRKYPNVVVLRTFSKIYGLAGARVGYLVGNPKVVSMVERTRQPFNVSSLALAGAVAALEDEDHLRKSVALNNSSKTGLIKELSSFPVRVFQSQGNFLLVDMKRSSKELYPEFLKKGVIIRPVANYGLPDHFRVTAGLPQENAKFIAAMDSLFARGKGVV